MSLQCFADIDLLTADFVTHVISFTKKPPATPPGPSPAKNIQLRMRGLGKTPVSNRSDLVSKA
jgi:hypothetical protein